MNGVLFRAVTPAGCAKQCECESVILPSAENEKGLEGGFLGIRRGHVQSVIALSKGTVELKASEEGCLRLEIAGGFATVQDNVVTVITESAVKL